MWLLSLLIRALLFCGFRRVLQHFGLFFVNVFVSVFPFRLNVFLCVCVYIMLIDDDCDHITYNLSLRLAYRRALELYYTDTFFLPALIQLIHISCIQCVCVFCFLFLFCHIC